MVGKGDDTSIRKRADPAIVKALARAFRWKQMLEDGRYASISEVATAEKIDRGYVGSILRLTLLAPDVVEAILNGRHPSDLGLARLLRPWPLEWSEPRRALGVVDDTVTAGRSALQSLDAPRRHRRSHCRISIAIATHSLRSTQSGHSRR